MVFGMRSGYTVVAAVTLGISASLAAFQQPGSPAAGPLPDFDIRAGRPPAAAAPAAQEALRRAGVLRGERAARLHPHTGALRVLERPSVALNARAAAAAARQVVESLAESLGLDAADLRELTPVRDYTSASTGLRTIAFAQSIDGIPVFEGIVTLHARPDGAIERVTSGAARGAGRPLVGGPRRQLPGTLVWFPMDGALRLATESVVETEDPKAVYDVIADAATGELLFRRNRVHYADGSGRVVQSAETSLKDPRLPDAMPFGASGPGGCPPPVNHLVTSLNVPFRDAATVLDNSGRLSGNNTHVFRGAARVEGAAGSFNGTAWSFDFPFGTAAAAETALFFSMNFVHDFFYDLGFDEAAGNFQADNFGRGGAAGDPLLALARASGRNNAYYQHGLDGTSPTIAMFLWDSAGCWSQDVDGDGTTDLDGDLDSDIVIHEFHHGVSLRLNTAWNGAEAAAMGEGGGDFFAYSINGDTVLADYARPGGIRRINAKGYADWSCVIWFVCEEHVNGEIWANVLWDVRERFRADLAGGSESAAVNESHQLYIDALKLSPPSPTMLDLRDAMLLADSLRNPGTPHSRNFCGIWEPFAARGMGVNASDTADNGFNRVAAGYAVPDGCVPPPSPPTITVAVLTASATEAGPSHGVFQISRGAAQPTGITISYSLAGTAGNGTDYVTLPGIATIPAGGAAVDVPVVPIDDPALEANETVVLSLLPRSSYVVGSPASGTLTIVSDDVAPDFAVTALAAPLKVAPGVPTTVADTTANLGQAQSPASTTSYYLSGNIVLDSADLRLGGRDVPALAPGASHEGSAGIAVPAQTSPGTYSLIAKADSADAIVESSEVNNTRRVSIQVGPDLTVSALSGPAAAGPGTTILVSDTTMNDGAAPAAASVTRFYLSMNLTVDAADVPLQSRSVPSLAPAAVHTATTAVTIPAGTVTGLFYLLAGADAEGSVAEAVETNNTRFLSLRVGPDLAITALAAPAQAAAGAAVLVTETTANIGQGAAPASSTALYLSANYSLDAADVRLSNGRPVPPLAAGASSTFGTTVTLPTGLAPGLWYVFAKADDVQAVAEVMESNNTRYAVVRIGPDLTVHAVSAPSPVVAGSAAAVTCTITNGGAQAAGASYVKFYLSTDLVLDAADVDLGSSSEIPALAAGASVTATTTVVIPNGRSGSFFLIAVADGTGVVAEWNEGNNRGFRWMSVSLPGGNP